MLTAVTSPMPVPPALLEQARRELAIDPTSPSGLRWVVSKKGVAKGKEGVAGSQRANGYWFVGIAGRKIQAGRLVLLLSNCEPGDTQHEVDHIDGNPGNNAVENLRWSPDNSDQNLNRKYGTSSGYRWVHKQSRHNTYFFQFVVPRSKPPRYVRGCGYSTPEEAHEQAIAARKEMGLPLFSR
jgi:hypothetical protein